VHFKLPLAALGYAVLAAAPSGAQQTVRLRLLPPVGQVSHYRTVLKTWMQIPGVTSGDSSQPIMDQTMYSTRKIVARHGGTWTATTVIDSSRMTGMGGRAPAGDMYRGLVVRQTVDSLGRTDSSAVTPPAGASPAMAQAMERGNSSSHSNLSLPLHPVRVGESWIDSTSVTVPGGQGQQAIQARVTYRLERLEHAGSDRVALISSTMSFVTHTAAASASATGVVNGTYRLDLDAGRLLDASSEMTMKMNTSAGTATSRTHSEVRLVH
jgi:hypothetical protein